MTRGRFGARLIAVLAPLIFAGLAAAASLDKAESLAARGEWKEARKHYAAVIRKGRSGDREEAYLGLARTYVAEKDYRGVIRSLAPIAGRLPESKEGVWMRLWLYRAARAVGDADLATVQYQSLLRLRAGLTLSDLAEDLRALKESDLFQKTPDLAPDPSTAAARRSTLALAESLMGLEVTGAAERMWTALVVGRPDDIGQTALLRLGQALDWQGKRDDAEHYLKLYVLLFPWDPGAADALYRLGKGSAALGSDKPADVSSLLIEFYPATLYGVTAAIDMAWTWPDRDRIRAVFRAVTESPGLPDPVLERGLTILLDHPDWLASESERKWVSKRYRLSFPLGPSIQKDAND